MLKHVAIGAAAMLLLAACQTPAEQMAERQQTLVAEGWQPLDQASMTSVLHDHTHTAPISKGRTWHGYYRADGTVSGVLNDGEADTGIYSVSNDGVYCRRWSKWRKAQEGCARFYRKGNELTSIRVSGSYNDEGSWTFEPGNTRNL